MSQNQFPIHHGTPLLETQQDVIQQVQAASGSSTASLPAMVRTSGTAQSPHHTTFVPPHSSNVPPLQQTQDPATTGSYLVPRQQNLEPMQQNELAQHQQGLSSAPVFCQQQGQPVQFVGSVPQQAQPSTINRSRKLQVDDALSYLERVRQQFTSEPQVYNDFLEVMKEFKSHTIDTNGVILRVSRLFRAYPDLIDGFNTFLPHGYEVRVHGSIVCIFEPNGTSSLINNASGELIDARVEGVPAVSATQISPTSLVRQMPIQHNQQANHSTDSSATGTSPTVSMVQKQEQKIGVICSAGIRKELVQAGMGMVDAAGGFVHQQPIKEKSRTLIHQQNYVAEVGTDQNAQAAKQQQQPQVVSTPTVQQQPIHFNEALGYLNRIKERFADRPDVYSEFLNILRNYQQREGTKKLTEADVYQAVSRLFHNEKDLMRDFKSFLPDAKLEFSDRQAEQFIQIGRGEEKESTDSQRTAAPSSSKVASTSIPNKRQIGKESINNANKKAKGQVTKVAYDVSISEILDEIPVKDFMIFEKIHHAIQSETIFENFLRCLMLYNKSLVSRSELLELVTPFLAGTPELLKQFKDVLGGQVAIDAQPAKQRRLEERLPTELASHIDYNTCKQHGVSYRSLPTEFERPRCSGRTALCNEVLNDTYVSYPTWSSEDTSAVSSKKSLFEDLMYRTEDERFEVDILIEINSAAIIALEYARRKIESMSHEEARKFMAENDLGCSPMVLTRAIRKLYGEHAGKMSAGLKENPLVAVPTILKRLREKDVEWRGTRKEFNVIWRDQVEKNYLKSLDHQSLTFKVNDIKNIRSKMFIQQLENIYKERMERAEEGQEEEHGPHVVIEYPSDRQVFHDANELLLHYIRRQANITKKEKGRIKELLHSVIPRLFMIELLISSDKNEDNKEDLSEKSEGEAESAKEPEQLAEQTMEQQQPVTRPRRIRQKHLIEEVREESKKTVKNVHNFGTKSGPSTSLSASSSSQCAVKQSIDALNIAYVLFFGTNSWVLFVRLHSILSDRLATIKKRTEELVDEYNVELQLRERQEQIYEQHGQSAEAYPMNAVDVHMGLRGLKKPLQNPEDFYQIMLQEMKNLLDGQVDGLTFEDTLRAMFDTKAYVLFTMDKLINALVRQLQNFVGDETSTKCIDLFNKYFEQRTNGNETGDDAARTDQEYCATAEKLLLKQNCFKMYFINRFQPTVTVELVDTDEPDSETDEEIESKNVIALTEWEDYLKKLDPNLLDDFAEGRRPRTFIRRNMRYRKVMAKYLQNITVTDDPKSPSKNTEETVQKMSRFYTSIGFGQILQLEDINSVSIIKLLKYESFWEPEPIFDVFVKKRGPAIDKKIFRKVSIVRQKRFHNWLDNFHKDDNELSARWMTTGCTSRPCQHPKFKYLRYNIYSSKISSE